MKRLLVFLAMAALVSCFALVIGCSDDDETTNPVVKQTGDLNDPEFEAAGQAFEIADMMTGELLGIMFITIDSILASPDYPMLNKYSVADQDAGLAADSFLLTYHTDTKFWYAEMWMIDTTYNSGDTMISSLSLIDSLQFLDGAVPVQWPDSGVVDGVKQGVAFVVSSIPGGNSVEAHQFTHIVGDLAGTGDVVINGNSSIAAQFSTGAVEPYCEFGMNLTSVFSNVNVNIDNMGSECPSSGSAHYTGQLDIACYGDTTITSNDHWSITQTFTEGNIHYVIENTTTRWEFDDLCGTSMAKSNDFAGIPMPLRK